MRNHSTIFFFIISLILFADTTMCQDSLYLIGTITGASTKENILDVKGVGDINGDGYDDFMVSVGYHAVKLYLGSSNFNLIPDIVFHYPGKEYRNSIGGCAGIGDVNGDSYNDFLLRGSYDNGAGGKGKVFLYYGGLKIDTIPVHEFSEPWIHDQFGSTLQGVGDLNKDGYDDFVIGSQYNWSDGKGRVYLYLGGDTISSQRSITFTSDTIGDFFGKGVANIGDINGDGFDDLAIGAPQNASGKVYIFYGGNPMNTIPDTVLRGIYLNEGYGGIIKSAGYFNKNNNIDYFIIGVNVYLYSGKNHVSTINGSALGSGGYVNVESNCDINHDGYTDFIIGNTNHRNSNSVMVGGAFIYLGGDKRDTVYKYKLEGENKWDEFSKIMTTADINGDGNDELFIMAPGYPDYINPIGKVYIYSYKKLTNVNEIKQSTPYKFDLYQNYPNPFNPETVISYQLPVTSYISLKVYDILGREIKTLVDGILKAGKHSIVFDGSRLSSGIYFYRLTEEHMISQKTMLLLK